MSDKPKRIQLRRTKGWRMPPNTVKVSRPGRWGNPFVIGRDVSDASGAVRLFRMWLAGALDREPGMCPDLAPRDAIKADLPELRGKNLACWCKPGEPCHADVLLELANNGGGQ